MRSLLDDARERNQTGRQEEQNVAHGEMDQNLKARRGADDRSLFPHDAALRQKPSPDRDVHWQRAVLELTGDAIPPS